MGKKRIVIDTNLFISALGWEGKPKALLDSVSEGSHELVISKKQFEEITRVLNYPKFDFSTTQKQRIILLLAKLAEVIKTHTKVEISDDVKDNMILEIAKETKIDYIITGDDDLLRLNEFEGAKIVTVTRFMRMQA